MNNTLASLHNIENYKSEWTHTVQELVAKQNSLLYEYLHLILEKTKKTFILIRGFETICHVFNMVLHASKNVDLAYYHGQKAYYFYVEFIEQITHDQNVYLNLSSRDAVLFVYKKTIYDIPHDKIATSESYSQTTTSVKIISPKEETDRYIWDCLTNNQQLLKNMVCFFQRYTDSNDYMKHIELQMEKTNATKNSTLRLLQALILVTEKLVTTSSEKYLFFLDTFLKKWVRLKGGGLVIDRVFEKIHTIEWDREGIDWLFI
jgi:hypothetical protein